MRNGAFQWKRQGSAPYLAFADRCCNRVRVARMMNNWNKDGMITFGDKMPQQFGHVLHRERFMENTTTPTVGRLENRFTGISG